MDSTTARRLAATTANTQLALFYKRLSIVLNLAGK